MQEELENRTLTLVISGSKFTGRTLKAAISKFLAGHKNKGDVIPHGKQTVKELVGQNQGVANIEISDPSIRQFDRIARKYGVDYAVKKDWSADPPKYLIFFKSRDADVLTVAFKEFAGKKVRDASRPSVLEKLAQFKEQIKSAVVDRHKKKELER